MVNRFCLWAGKEEFSEWGKTFFPAPNFSVLLSLYFIPVLSFPYTASAIYWHITVKEFGIRDFISLILCKGLYLGPVPPLAIGRINDTESLRSTHTS